MWRLESDSDCKSRICVHNLNFSETLYNLSSQVTVAVFWLYFLLPCLFLLWSKEGTPFRSIHICILHIVRDSLRMSMVQALSIPTKINRGTVEIVSDVKLITKGDKVGASEATLLAKLGIKPFSYGLIIRQACAYPWASITKNLIMIDKPLHRTLDWQHHSSPFNSSLTIFTIAFE